MWSRNFLFDICVFQGIITVDLDLDEKLYISISMREYSFNIGWLRLSARYRFIGICCIFDPILADMKTFFRHNNDLKDAWSNL